MKLAQDNTEARHLFALAEEAIAKARASKVTEAAPLLLDAINQLQTAYRALQEEFAVDTIVRLRCVGGV